MGVVEPGVVDGALALTSANPSSGIGIPKSKPNLLGDLVGSALGQGRGMSANVPFKSAPPKNAFRVGKSPDSLPRLTATTTFASSMASSTPTRPDDWRYADKVGNYSFFNQPASKIGAPMSISGQPMKSMGGIPVANAKQNPFSSLDGFGTKSSGKPLPPWANSSYTSSDSTGAGASAADFPFGAFQNANPTNTVGSGNSSGCSFSSPPQPPPPPPPPMQKSPKDCMNPAMDTRKR
ncbi:protein transport protein sec31-like [Zingiber officinale]|uniref:protein transport protein sec31-like n=1 Tax=Zingiber officinale TaxID=94328 RepID=UPI001C4CA458|nr:protein transport protein sec31-like [Zingiber officinale]